MRRPFIVVRTRGTGWDDARPPGEQADFVAHEAFMESLVAEGFVAVGGLLEGTRDALLVIQAESAAEIEQRLAGDPWTRTGRLIVKQCWPWRIGLGSLG